MQEPGSVFDTKRIARAAIAIAMTADREEERACKAGLLEKGIRAAAVDFGGEFVHGVSRIVERTIVAAKREGLISSEYHVEGALAGAAREAISCITNKAIGLNVGGKIGIARTDSNIAVCLFFGVGLLHLDEIAVGFGHRAI